MAGQTKSWQTVIGVVVAAGLTLSACGGAGSGGPQLALPTPAAAAPPAGGAAQPNAAAKPAAQPGTAAPPAAAPQATAAGPAASAPPAAAPAQQLRITMGTTPSSSSAYVYPAAVARALSRWVPEIEITPTETGGSVDNIKRVARGDFKMSLTAYDTLYPAHNGLNEWASNPVTNLRPLWTYSATPIAYVVREDSGVKTLYDLTGRDFSPSGKGTASEKITEQAFEVLGIKPKYYRGGIDDAVAAVKDKRIVGYGKVAGGLRAPDATTMDIATSAPVRVLGFTKEDIDKIQAKYPYFGAVTVPAGVYKGDFNKDPILTLGVVIGMSFTSDIPEEIGYKVVKAIWEHKDELVQYHADFKDMDPRYTLNTVPTVLHAGAIRYYREIGLQVPEKLIPPEAKR